MHFSDIIKLPFHGKECHTLLCTSKLFTKLILVINIIEKRVVTSNFLFGLQ